MADEATDNPNGAAEAATFTFNDDGSFNLPDGTKVGTQKELGEGWMRQADYTRKTQDLAIQRKEVETATNLMSQLEQNPSGTLQALANSLGVDLVAPSAAPTTNHQNDDWDTGGWDNGSSQELSEDPRITKLLAAVETLQSQVGQVAGNQARNSVESELAQVTSKFAEDGIDIDPGMLARYARSNNLDNLESAATLLYHEDVVAAQVAKQTADAGVVESKRAAGQAVTSATGVAGESPATKVAGSDGMLSIREALEEAMAESGITDLRDLSFSSSSTSY
jgi:hypothetical protein